MTANVDTVCAVILSNSTFFTTGLNKKKIHDGGAERRMSKQGKLSAMNKDAVVKHDGDVALHCMAVPLQAL